MTKSLLVLMFLSVGVLAYLDIQMEHICFKNRCFLFIESKRTWRAAQKDCRKQGAKLAVLNDAATISQIFKYINDQNDGFWIKLGDRLPCNTCGALRGKPCIQLKNEHHLHTHFIVNILEHRLTLDQTSCTQKANYICEKVVQITEEIKANKSQTTEKDISKSDRKNANQVHNGLGEGVVVGIVIIICITIVAAIVIVGQLLKKIKRVDSSRRPLHRYQSNNSWSESGENNYINYPFTVPYNSTDTRSFVNPISSRTGCSVDVIPLQTVHESFDCSVTSSGVCSLVTSIHSQSANNRSRMNSGYQPRGGNKTSEESKMVF